MSSAEQGYLFENLRKVISLIDKLRDIGMQKYISLPRIAVLGSQSAGKSSLLEQIVGLDFLPRGSGVVTRRPLELRLVYVPKESLPKPYGVFEEIKNEKFTDFQQVKANIDKLTDKVAGANKGIVDKPIILTIYSSTCPDLTLIDLPGITRIPMGGTDQKQDIEKVTKDMAARYCSDPNTIILCVIPANDDLSNSDGLQMAKRLDPKGERTFGVLTKLDIMDQGTNAKDSLLGKTIPLNLGYVGVINRTNLDIKNNKPVIKHLEDEKKYFSQHPIYSTLPSEFTGTSSLTKKVTEIFYTHIRKFLPVLEEQMNKILKEKETRLNQLGTPLPETDQERIQYLWQVVSEFGQQFKTSIAGTYHRGSVRNQLPVGCQIRDILKDLYSEESKNKVCSIYSDKDIQRAMQYHEGDSIPGFPSIDAFMSLLIPQLKKLKDPAFDTLQETYALLEELAINILTKVLAKLPALKEELQESIINSMVQEREKTRDIIEDVIETEINYVFTNDHYYMNEATTTPKINTNPTGMNNNIQQNQNQNNQVANKQQQQNGHVSGNPMVHELRKRIDMYFRVVMRSVRDTIPKIIGTFLVKNVQEQLKTTLFETVNRSKHFFQFMQEPKHIVEERQELRKGIKVMREAKQTIKRDPDLSTLFHKERSIVDSQIKSKPSSSSQNKNQNQNQSQKSSQQSDLFNMPPQNNNQQQQQSKQQQQNQQQQQNKNTGQQQQQKQQESSLQSLFGVAPKASTQSSQQNSQRSSQQVSTNNSNNTSFSNQPKPQQQQNIQNQQNNNVQQQQQQQKQQNQPPKQGFIDETIDKSVDNMFKNQKFQDGLKGAANKGMYAAVDSQVPVKGKDGKNPVADFMGKQAEKAVQNEKVQKEMNNQMKAQAKDQVQQQKKKNTFW